MLKNLKYRRVKAMLAHIQCEDGRIYYSRISTTLLLITFIAINGLVVFLNFPLRYSIPVAAAYFVLCYLLNTGLGNSIAVSTKGIVIINPNIPFRRLTKMKLRNIEQVELGNNRVLWPAGLFMVLSGHYIQIQCAGVKKRYYCTGLELDGFEEGQAEYSLDNLRYQLEQQGLQVVWKLNK